MVCFVCGVSGVDHVPCIGVLRVGGTGTLGPRAARSVELGLICAECTSHLLAADGFGIIRRLENVVLQVVADVKYRRG